MSRQRSARHAAALAVLLALSWNGALALDRWTEDDEALSTNVSGAPPDFRPGPVAVPLLRPDLDDMLRPIGVPTAPAIVSVDRSDVTAPHADESARALWQRLSALTPEQRSNAVIEFEPAEASPAEGPAAVAALWNAGHHAEAVEALRALEEQGLQAALGIAWRPGTGPAFLRDGADVRIGGTVSDALAAAVDFDEQNGHLFCVLRCGSTTTQWTMNISVDGGGTWNQTYSWWGSAGLIDVSAAVVDAYVYVGYIYAGAASELRVRRCLVADGSVDSIYGFQTILTSATATLEEVSVATNAEDYDNRIYCVTLQSDQALRHAWDVASDGTTFTEASPSVTADFGLDATWDHSRGTCNRFLFVSYVNTDGWIHVLALDEGVAWSDRLIASADGTLRPPSISAYGDMVICAYEHAYAEGRGIEYRISYDCADAWNVGSLAIPDGATVTSYTTPDVDARDGHGTAMAYSAEVGEPDAVYYHVRAGFAPGPWSAPIPFNDHDVTTGAENTLAHVHSVSLNGFSHGAVYLGGGIPWYDHPGAGIVDAPVIAAGAPGLQLFAAEPNPLVDHGMIRFSIPTGGHARLQIFDVLGRRIATLLDRPVERGTHAVPVDGKGLGSGVYFYRLTWGGETQENRLVVIR